MIGCLTADAELTPYPTSDVQQHEATSAITEPTDISVPADTAIVRVIPIASMAISLPLFAISISLPYNTPLFIEICKKLGDLITLTRITNIKHTAGKNNLLPVHFFQNEFFSLLILVTSRNSFHDRILRHFVFNLSNLDSVSKYNHPITRSKHFFNLR